MVYGMTMGHVNPINNAEKKHCQTFGLLPSPDDGERRSFWATQWIKQKRKNRKNADPNQKQHATFDAPMLQCLNSMPQFHCLDRSLAI